MGIIIRVLCRSFDAPPSPRANPRTRADSVA